MEHLITQLQKTEKLGRLAHAYLFYSDDPEQLGDFLDNLLKDVFNMPDYLKNTNFKIIEKKDDENEIKIEDIRDAIQFLSLSSLGDSYKIVVIKDAERMTKGAANALLKILEEPTRRKIIILTTKNKNNIMPTIYSRIQAVRVFTKGKKYVIKHTKEYGLAEDVFKGGVVKRLDIAEKASKEGISEGILSGILHILHNDLYDSLGCDELSVGTSKTQNDVKNIKDRIILAENAKGLLLKTNANPRLILENLFLAL